MKTPYGQKSGSDGRVKAGAGTSTSGTLFSFRGVVVVIAAIIFISALSGRVAGETLVPMDLSQTNHLKAYGLVWYALSRGVDVKWLLNYRGGSFLMPDAAGIGLEAQLRNILVERVSPEDVAGIYREIEGGNMEIILLEKAPEIAIYAPPNKQPWDDAVMMALEYAGIPYETVYDKEVLLGQLERFDWLHLHHEDFTGQYGKFYAGYRNAQWYIQQQVLFEQIAMSLGFKKVSEEKKAVAELIREYLRRGGFLFAMCSACDTVDLALAARGIDIVPREYDHDGTTPGCTGMLDFGRTLAFEGVSLIMDPYVYEFSDIDMTQAAADRGEASDYFTLFDFSAKYDPVPSMLVQNHVSVIKGFMGQTTSFRKSLIKKKVIILGEVRGRNEARYIHGNLGKGTFTFFGGHDPEDYHHFVGDPPTDLNLYPNSPGYRLILNNVLFPAARKKEQKT